jgi:hypothetical protein
LPAAFPDGCSEALMLANEFTAEMLIELSRTGLATTLADGICGSLRRDGGRLHPGCADRRALNARRARAGSVLGMLNQSV